MIRGARGNLGAVFVLGRDMATGRDLRACFIGDSYVAGAGDDSGLGWVGRVAASARAAGADLTPYNLGVRGQTGPQMAWRAGRELKPRMAGGDVHAAVIAFGTNDIAQGLPLAVSVAAAGRLIGVAGRLGGTAFLLSPPKLVDPARDTAAARMADAMEALCARRGVAYLDLREAVADWDLWWRQARAGDGAHPNAAGYALIADVVSAWAPWRAWLGL
ncbi:MAG: GDSL-like Lipase/Acylhydrolase [Caulobacter sp.]|nr:GDSL-like Lipase/Acylhydrolase [Caulobacter sp.]